MPNVNLAVEQEILYRDIVGIKAMGSIGQESLIDDIFVRVKNYFLEAVPSIARSFSNNATRAETFNKDDFSVFLKDVIDMDKRIRAVDQISYSSVDMIKVPTMIGLKINLVEMSSILVEASEYINVNLKPCLDYADVFIALVTSDKDFRTATRINTLSITQRLKEEHKKHDLSYERLYNIVSKLESYLPKIIDSKLHIDQRPMKDLIPNISSLHHVQQNLLRSAKGITLDYTTNISNEIKGIGARAEDLHTAISSDKEFVVTTPILRALGDVLEDTAKIVTASVTMWHVINQGAGMLKMVIETLERNK